MKPEAGIRFADRASDYGRYRPSYPAEILEILKDDCGLQSTHQIADLGSGTGLLTHLFLANGNPVTAIEPCNEMRRYGDWWLSSCFNYRSVRGSAENTGLPDASADFTVAGHAAHWFDTAAAKKEILRISKPDGWCVCVWNTRQPEASPFMRAYSEIMEEFALENVGQPGREGGSDRDPAALLGENFRYASVLNRQTVDLDALFGRTRSSSMMPIEGQAGYQKLASALNNLFRNHSSNGHVEIIYNTEIYWNKIELMST